VKVEKEEEEEGGKMVTGGVKVKQQQQQLTSAVLVMAAIAKMVTVAVPVVVAVAEEILSQTLAGWQKQGRRSLVGCTEGRSGLVGCLLRRWNGSTFSAPQHTLHFCFPLPRRAQEGQEEVEQEQGAAAAPARLPRRF
jgi:hypothetical protein